MLDAPAPRAIVEAKDNNHGVGDGMQQGLGYAEMLDVPFVFSSNGDGFLFHDRTGHAAKVEQHLSLDEFPSPEELWRRYCAWKSLTPAVRGHRHAGLLLRRQRQEPALLPGQRHQPRRRGRREGAEPRSSS